MPYDHRWKAGNEGDVVKHVALFAAIDLALARGSPRAFVYSDMFAGRAATTLAPGAEWTRGIGALWRKARSTQVHVDGYVAAHLRDEPAAKRVHAGSVSVAAERAAARGRDLVVKAWDVSPGCAASLRAALPRAQVTEGPVELHLADAADADLVLFDPPALASWATAGRPVLEAATRAAVLCWLPCRILERAAALAAEARALGCDVLRVRYGRTAPSGCMLLVRAPDDDARGVWLAVEALGALLDWEVDRERHAG